jgi:hypothetical protein
MLRLQPLGHLSATVLLYHKAGAIVKINSENTSIKNAGKAACIFINLKLLLVLF